MTSPLPHAELFVPVFVRCVGAVSLLPLDGGLAGILQRGVLAAVLAIFLMGVITGGTDWQAAELVLEFLVGLIVSLPAALVPASMAMALETVDTARGQNASELYDPVNGHNTAVSGMIGRYLGWAVLFSSGVALHQCAMLCATFAVVPPGDAGRLLTAATGIELLRWITALLVDFSLWLAPLLMLFVGIDLILGVLGKLLPGVSLQGEGLLLKTAVTLSLSFVLLNQAGLGSLLRWSQELAQLLGSALIRPVYEQAP